MAQLLLSHVLHLSRLPCMHGHFGLLRHRGGTRLPWRYGMKMAMIFLWDFDIHMHHVLWHFHGDNLNIIEIIYRYISSYNMHTRYILHTYDIHIDNHWYIILNVEDGFWCDIYACIHISTWLGEIMSNNHEPFVNHLMQNGIDTQVTDY